MNTKAILASTLFTVLLASTTAQADRKGDVSDYPDNSVTTESVQFQKVSLNTAIYADVNGGRK